MSDQSQGPGWWQASDGKWYSPERHPNYVVPAAPPPPMAPPQPQVIVQQVEKRGCLWWVGMAVVACVVIGIIAAIAGAGDDAEPRRTVTTESDQPAEEPEGPLETVSQKNAREKAEDYLDFGAFSRTGLIKQLKFEGFSDEDAAYGVDAQGADWNQQAAKKAEDYMDFGSFSRASLIKQLEFEGFTPEEAAHGASAVGL